MLMDDILFSDAFREMLKNTMSCSFFSYLSTSNNTLRKSDCWREEYVATTKINAVLAHISNT